MLHLHLLLNMQWKKIKLKIIWYFVSQFIRLLKWVFISYHTNSICLCGLAKYSTHVLLLWLLHMAIYLSSHCIATRLEFQKTDDFFIILRLMWKSTVCTDFKCFSIFFFKVVIARTIFQVIQRTITKQTIKICQSLMAGEIFALIILKKFIWVFHFYLPASIHNT